MNPTRAIARFFGLAFLAALAAGFAGQREARIKAETEHTALEQQLEILRSIAAENAQLSNLLARASAPKPPLGDKSPELLRLRGEVGLLRRQAAGLESVLNENRQAHAAADRSSGTRGADAGKATPDYWPRDSWAFAGHASPDAALQTSLWAANNGDLKAVLAAATGKLREAIEADLAGKSETEVSIRLMDEVAGIQSVRVLDRADQSDGTVLITAAFEKQNDTQTRKLVLQKVGDDWMIASGQ